MRIAFVSANREKLPDEVIPLGLLYVMASTSERHERELWDLLFPGDPLEHLAAQLKRYKPELIALGLRNIQNTEYTGLTHNMKYYSDLMACIRKHSSAKVVIGGSAFSVMPKELMNFLRPDFGIQGEGEAAFPALLEALTGQRTVEQVPGLLWMENGEVRSTSPAAMFLDLDSLPSPDRSQLDPRYYAHASPIDSVQTKRGCALKCDYCTYPIIEGRSIRLRDPKRVVDELLKVTQGPNSVPHVFIVDSVFNLPLRHAKAVCQEMIDRGFRTPWTCYANPIRFDEEMADLMKRSGCAGMEIGSDSGVNHVLDALRKGFTTDDIRSMHALSVAHGLRDCHTFILGTPSESFDDVRTTLDFISDLDPYAAILMVWTDDYEALEPELAAKRKKLRDQVTAILEERKRAFPRWIIPALGVHFNPSVFDYLRRLGFKGPLWQHIRAGQRLPEAS